MNYAETCRKMADQAREKELKSKVPRVVARIGDKAVRGGTHLICWHSRGTVKALRGQGFRCISLGILLLITW